jgi:four helix bundle protein
LSPTALGRAQTLARCGGFRSSALRAGESVALDISEARQRAGLDRTDLYRRAAGSAAELTTALRIARARGSISHAEHTAVEAALDRVRAMLWKLTH